MNKLALITVYSNRAIVEVLERPPLAHGEGFSLSKKYEIEGEWNASKAIQAQTAIRSEHGEIPVMVDSFDWLKGRVDGEQ